MSAYLRNWLGGSSYTSSASSQPQQPNTQPQESGVDISFSNSDSSTREDEDDEDSDATETDTPPTFPAINSAQRLGSSTAKTTTVLPKVLTDPSLMPPPPSPSNALRVPGAFPSSAGSSSFLSPSASLMPPPSSNRALNLNASGSGSGSRGGAMLGVLATTNVVKTGKKAREKVALKPGFGPLDWAELKSSGADLRGVDTLLRVTPSMLKEHNKKDDAWSAFYGKVYNITPYLPYHPGGEKELMRVAGRDGTKLFASTHAWVNAEFMLDLCLVGFLVSESYGS